MVSHEVKSVYEFIQDGVKYTVDGKDVKLDPSTNELNAAELLKKELGGDIRLMPKVAGRYRNIGTPDFLYNNARLDLKVLTGKSKNLIENRIHKSKNQAENFMLDISNTPLSEKEIIRQANQVFYNKHLDFVDYLIITKNGKIIKIIQRVK